MKDMLMFCMPRTASQQMLRLFHKYYHVSNIGCCKFEKINKGNKFLFGFVRNPWEFWVSSFFYNATENQFIDSQHWFWFNKWKRESWFGHARHFKLYVIYMYQRFLTNDWKDIREKILLPLSEYYKFFFYDKDNNYIIDYVGHFENKDNDLKKVFCICDQPYGGAKPTLAQDTEKTIAVEGSIRKKTNHYHYSWYYDKVTIECIATMEKFIIDKYNYHYENKYNDTIFNRKYKI